MLVEFEGGPTKFLGMKWQQIADNESITIHLSQEATISALVEELGLEYANSVHPPTYTDVQSIIFRLHTTPPSLDYKQHNNNWSHFLAPSTGSPVAHALTLQQLQMC